LAVAVTALRSLLLASFPGGLESSAAVTTSLSKHQEPLVSVPALVNALDHAGSQMPNPFRIPALICFALMACGLAGCGTINEKLTEGLADVLPQWAGGLPPDAPPRPGTAKYDAYMKEQERKRLEPAPPKDAAGQPSSSSGLEPVH
jgi:hypothetical protein